MKSHRQRHCTGTYERCRSAQSRRTPSLSVQRGGTGRASGWACDTRKRHPYSMYGKVDFKEIVHTEGDSFARYMVRMEEIMESMNIIEQLIDNIPEGAFQQKMKPIIRVPEGSYYAAVEGSRGEFGVFLESRGDKYPYRLKFRATGLPLVSAMETMCAVPR